MEHVEHETGLAQEAREIPLRLIGLDTRPERQIRPLDVEHVRALMETTIPKEWDPIEVREWPEDDPRPRGEEECVYQVISGYHRTTAARNLGLNAIRAVVITDALDEVGFQLRAFRTNARHGKPMSTDEKQALARRLRAFGMSETDIAREMSTPKGTIHNWLSGRNTNANRHKEMMRTHQTTGNSRPDEVLPAAWHVSTVALDARRAAAVSSTIADFLAATPTHLAPGEVVAWVNMQPPQFRHALATDIAETARWLGALRAVLMEDKPTAEGAA